MPCSAGKGELENESRSDFLLPLGKENRVFDRETRRVDLSRGSTSIRKEKVKEAERKKQNREYYTEEVYKKIADRLMDLFGIR
ncbi:MAG: hypothetical protein GTO24_18340 [candidate division Zixibacteria bacterium]|nr:hypothetical protein [candidate division Zixibacteria bacterium]